MKYEKGQVIKIKEPISCLAHTIPVGNKIRICYVNYMSKNYDIVDCNNPHAWIDEVPETDIVEDMEG